MYKRAIYQVPGWTGTSLGAWQGQLWGLPGRGMAWWPWPISLPQLEWGSQGTAGTGTGTSQDVDLKGGPDSLKDRVLGSWRSAML